MQLFPLPRLEYAPVGELRWPALCHARLTTTNSPEGASHADDPGASGFDPLASLVAAASARPDCDRIRRRELGPAGHLARLARAALWRLLPRGWSPQRLDGSRGPQGARALVGAVSRRVARNRRRRADFRGSCAHRAGT